MAIYNVFVKLLDGKTATLKFPNQEITGEILKSDLYNLTHIPPQNQRLLTGTHQIYEKTLISLPTDGFITIHLLLRLIGGKGGFGSLLRGAATKAGQKKTNNFDACRDMSGRRLRHVNAEKKLEEWKSEAEERRLEKVAEEFIKKKVKERKKAGSSESEKYIAKYRVDSEKCMEDVEASVKASILIEKNAKRKILPSSGSVSKKLKLWMSKEKGKVEESDSDDSEEEEEEEECVVGEGSYAVRNKDGEGSSGSVLEGFPSEGKSNLVEENGVGVDNGGSFEVGEGSGKGEIIVEENGNGRVEAEVGEGSDNGEIPVEENGNGMVEAEVLVQCETVSRLESSQSHSEGSAEMKEDVVEANNSVASTAVNSEKNPNLEKPLDFDDYNTSTEMEVLGMEKLKTELQVRGLKCGGTLQERAARLFLLKTTPIEKLPKKLLAKK